MSRTSTTTAINVDWLTPKVVDGLYQESFYVLKKWQVSQASASGVFDNNLVAVVSLAITVAAMVMTGGTSAFVTGTLLSQMGQVAGSAALSQLQQQAVISLMRTGDPVATGKELISDESVRSLAITAASAGAFRGMSSYLNVSTQPHGFVEQARTQLLKASINTTLQSTIGGQDFVDTWKANMLRAAIDTAAGTAANSIGEAYKGENQSLNYVTHKIAHGILGAGMGALLSDDRTKGAVTGAIAGIVAEIVGEYEADQLIQQAQGRDISEEEFLTKQSEAVLKAKFVTALTACVSDQDATLASRVAENAVLNNSFLIKPLLKKIFKESIKKTGREAAKNTGKEVAKQEAKEIAKQEAKQVAKEAGKQEAKNSAKNVIKSDLTEAQQARINKIDNIIENHAKSHDFEGVSKELRGISTGYDHYTEMKESTVGLEKSINALKNSLNNPNLDTVVRNTIEGKLREGSEVLLKMQDTLAGK